MINIADLLMENNTASERPNNDNPIVDYSDNHEKIDNDTKVEDNESLEESYITSKKDIEYKLDSWKKGSDNILLITGLSGSGKSTRASQLSKEYNAINFELDLFEHNSILFSNNYNHDEANIIMKDIFKKMYGGKKNFDKYSDEDYRKEFVKFFKNLLSYCKSHKDQLFIIEGLQIFKHVAYYDISIIENTPIIIIGTSLTKSLIRRYKRDHNTSDGSFKHPIQLMKKYIEWEKSLNNLRNSDYLKESSNNSELYPVYIVTSYTDTKFGKIIRKASDCYYTHAAISFESDLHEMYSFGNSGTLSNSKLGGMTCESLNDYIKTSKNAVILVSVVFVKEKDYKKLLAFFDEYLNNSRNTRYNYSNLFNVLKNKPISNTPSLSYICSQFVDSLFKFISIDMTNKPSNLVTPEDIANLHNVKPTVYKLFEGRAIDYNINRIEKILDKMYSKAKPIKEVTLLEAKEFPIQFNDEGDLLISKKEKIDFLAEYNKSKKLRQSYVKYKNLEGLKYECCKMWYINTILMKLLDDKNLSHSDREDYNNYRSKILTEFSQYLKEIQKIDKSFNFGSFYETTPFSNTKIKINGSTIKYTTKLMKFIFK